MKPLLLTWEYPPHIVGGLGSHVGDLVPALDRLGVPVAAITPNLRGGESAESLPGGSVVHRVAVTPPDMSELLRAVQATNAQMQSAAADLTVGSSIDLVHAHDWMVSFASVGLKHRLKLPLVVTIHATERGRARGGLQSELNVAINGNEWWLCYEAWRIITTSRYMADQVVEYFQVPRDKIDIIPNGVDPARFDALPDRESEEVRAFRRRFAADDEALVYHVGRLVHEKGAHLIVEAAPQVLANIPRVKFVIAGKGPLLDDLRRRAAALGLADSFYFTGFISDDDRNRLYRAADVAVFPSLYEPFGIVALEAMAAGTPVVVAMSGGLAEVVDHAETGIHVYPDDARSLAWGITHTLGRPDWARHRASNARRKVDQVFDWSRIARLTRDVYARTLSERQAVEWE